MFVKQGKNLVLKQKPKKKKGISLIVLVITIIILTILAAAIIISINNTNIMTKANEATFKADIQNLKSAYSLWLAGYIAESGTYDITTINYTAGDPYLLNTILGGNVPDKYKAGLKVVEGRLIYDADNEGEIVITYSVEYNLSNCTSSNTATSINYGDSYSATLTADTGYDMSLATVTIIMGGVDVTSSVYSSGQINMPNVNGNIVITASFTSKDITYNLSNCTSSNVASIVASGATYATTLTPNTGYSINSVVVTMGGVDVTSTVYNSSTHAINIASTTGNVVVTASASKITYTVTNTLSNCTNSNTATSINYGDSYSATLTASTGYTLSTATVTIGGSEVSGAYSNGSISLTNVTGNVVITATATASYTAPTSANGSWNSSKGVNNPKLYSGMTAIAWDSSGNEVVITDSNYNDWFDYSSQKWANAKTADGSYWVWIPRYAYKINSMVGQKSTTSGGIISVKFLQGITNKDSDNTTISKAYPTVTNNVMDAYVVHPAFIDDSGSNYMHGGWDKELPGIWVAKYEMSMETSTNSGTTWSTTVVDDENKGDVAIATNSIRMVSKPGVTAWGYITISKIYTNCLAYNTALQSHMMKNSEWGAVAYLTQSSYGRNGTEVSVNESSDFYTGGVKGATVNSNTDQSTTGNNTGIFDMAGGSLEYVAGYVSNGNAALTSYGSSFAYTTATTTGYQTLSTKYVTVYPYDSVNEGWQANYLVYKNAGYGYGDAILETSNPGKDSDGWFYDFCYVPDDDTPFFLRGGTYHYGWFAGIFSSNMHSGNVSIYASYRVILSRKLVCK